MLASLAIARIQRLLGGRQDLAVVALEELQFAQSKFERGGVPMPNLQGAFHPWFLLTDIQTFSTTIADEVVPLPDDFLREDEDGGLYIYNASSDPVWTELVKDDEEFLRNSALGTGTPKGYSLSGLNWRLYGVPDSVITLKTTYFAKQPQITADPDTENEWLKWYPDLLLGEAGMATAAFARDKDIVQYFSGIRAEAVAQCFTLHEARKHDRRQYAMGGPD